MCLFCDLLVCLFFSGYVVFSFYFLLFIYHKIAERQHLLPSPPFYSGLLPLVEVSFISFVLNNNVKCSDLPGLSLFLSYPLKVGLFLFECGLIYVW